MASATQPFFRRRFAPLIAAWVLALTIAGAFYWIERSMPAFHDVIVPLYWIVGGFMVLATWRWIRTRGKGDRRRNDRRHGDRRHQ